MKLSSKLIIFGLLCLASLSAEPIIFAEDLQPKVQVTSSEVPISSFFKSAIVPGWGELSANNYSGFVFITAETILWLSKYYVNNERTLSERKAHNYAVQFAHIDPSLDFDEDFYDHMKAFASSGYETGGYNSFIAEQAIARFPNKKEAQTLYIAANSYSEEYSWNWDSYDDRAYYSGRRTDILDFSDVSKAITGVIILNHLISGINSLRGSAKRKRLETRVSLDSEFNPLLFVSYKF
ncbi:MAG: hypothetical protein KAS49_02805 [Candidatus Cloacimonetes bacterium]|nr:hypothetical protein [Candidatus Cloacimonadota bacterium]